MSNKFEDDLDRSYARADQKMSKRVYTAQFVYRVFGPAAARIFMRVMQVDGAVAARVLRSPLARLRR
ncbi:hypothetical protein [Massilia sp. Leaf139]|uniref:hypothetical protein n=1 Tax=Massilia sp. Leaf139 TaxID=1736272 RepID=UPI0006F93BDA|nr:hypothetical protein [Massilia sp. Leaf139]KQQ87248.1 hypothetical protein ASF77_16820 [Massilia sp. Leaf139]